MPISQFETVYQSKDGRFSIGFSISEEMYFLAIGFPLWDGFRVFQDPTYAAYSAVTGSATSSFAPTITESPAQTNIEADVGTVLELSWVAQDTDPANYEIYDANNNVVASGSWFSGIPVPITVTVAPGTQSYYIIFYDVEGYSVQSGTITITGTTPTTTTPPTSTGPGPTTTTPPTTSVISRTSAPVDTGVSGFTLEIVLALISVVTPVIVLKNRRRKV
jgi:hypothetical protein